jgi:hypothetical protein
MKGKKTTTYKIEIAVDGRDEDKFCAWLDNQGQNRINRHVYG